MESITISQFKATFLSILDNIQKQKRGIIITKRGKPIAELIPYPKTNRKISLRDTVTFMGDIVSPVVEEDWKVLK
jgi:prevent-host-death family protein